MHHTNEVLLQWAATNIFLSGRARVRVDKEVSPERKTDKNKD